MTPSIAAIFAEAVVRQAGARFLSLREIVGQGAVNHVFVVNTSDGEWVFRFHIDPLETDDYAKEEWCLRNIRQIGIPVPEFLARGFCDDRRFIIQRFVSGKTTDGHRSPELWRTLGRYARMINELPLDESAPGSLFPRFGRDLVQNWGQHVAYNLEQLTDDDPLIALGAHRREDRDKLIRIFEPLASLVDRFGLTHGDLVPKNVILPKSGPPVLIDWGSAGTGPTPYHDYIRIWSDAVGEGFTTEDLNGFAEGYGIPLNDILDTMRDINLLGRIDVCRWAMDHRPDRLPKYVERAAKAVSERS